MRNLWVDGTKRWRWKGEKIDKMNVRIGERQDEMREWIKLERQDEMREWIKLEKESDSTTAWENGAFKIVFFAPLASFCKNIKKKTQCVIQYDQN